MNLNNWQQTSTVSMIVSDGEAEQEYRLTFGTMNTFDKAMFDRRRQQVGKHLTDTYGTNWPESDEAMALLSVMVGNAIILSSLKKVEVKIGDVWEETKLPDAWYDPKRFPYEVPAGMIDTLLEAVAAAGNPPRLFSFLPSGDEEKKVLRMIVSSSVTSLKPS